MKTQSKLAGYTLTELVLVIAIISTLTVIVIPEFFGIKYSAAARINEANADILTKVAAIIETNTGISPDWPSEFTSITPAGALNLIHKNITYQGAGHFSYDSKTKTVISLPEVIKPALGLKISDSELLPER
jgi:prepilin-type N-terminal cleavage/methylation domain-containing protein